MTSGPDVGSAESLPKTANGADTAASQKRGVDYSKFDSIVDSDDEKPAAKPEAKASPSTEKPHCLNCHKDVEKPLRCGICKKAVYCTAQCQKEDWQFHKRICKKPETNKPKESEEPKRPRPAAEAKKKEEEKVVETEENLTWYRHREWKPTAEPKQEFRPTKISDEEAAVPAIPKNKSAGSAWNAAGTWEDKDVTESAKSSLSAKFADMPDIDAVGGAFSVQEVCDVGGEASKPVVRGKQRHLFDLSFKVKFIFKWNESEGQKRAEGTIEISDFCNDTTFSEGDSAPGVKLSFQDSTLDAQRRRAVEASTCASQWPAPAGSLMAAIASRMQAWSAEYQTETEAS